ncbi:MAG: SufBD protein [Eubacteriaceae bacterium]|nr:SufBD protein [Eubacteriaceae bacterium]
MQKEEILQRLTSKDNKAALEFTKQIVSESMSGNWWYEHFEVFHFLLSHPGSFVRNRALMILAALAKWDENEKFDEMLDDIFKLITDPKPITSRQCIGSLCEIGRSKPEYAEKIISAFKNADVSVYKDSMRNLIEKDITGAIKTLTDK